MQIGKYSLVNEDKLNRAMFGTPIGTNGEMKGGVGEDADPSDIIVEYDRLGGLVLMGKHKVKTGGFWDFKGKKAVAKPKPMLIFNINGAFGIVRPLAIFNFMKMQMIFFHSNMR